METQAPSVLKKATLRWLLTLTSVAIWLVSLALDVWGGTNPGFVPRDRVYPYPTLGVLTMAAVVTIELSLLLFILRPRTYTHASHRVLIALAVFTPLWIADFSFVSGWTDQAGFVYTNGYFLMGIMAFLLFLAGWRLLDRRRRGPLRPDAA